MANVEFKLNLSGLNELMKSGEMQAVLNSAANQLAAAANANQQIKSKDGEGFSVEAAHPIRFIAIAAVKANDFEARLDNSKFNTLEKAKGSVSV